MFAERFNLSGHGLAPVASTFDPHDRSMTLTKNRTFQAGPTEGRAFFFLRRADDRVDGSPPWYPVYCLAPPFRILCEGWELRAKQATGIYLQCGADRLDFRVLLQHFMTHFAPPTRLFIPTKGQSSVENVVAVNPNRTGAELGSQAMRL